MSSIMNLDKITALDLLTYVADLYDTTPNANEKMFQLDFLDPNLNMRTMNMFPDDDNDQKEIH